MTPMLLRKLRLSRRLPPLPVHLPLRLLHLLLLHLLLHLPLRLLHLLLLHLLLLLQRKRRLLNPY